MTVKEMAAACGWTLLAGGEGEGNQIDGCYIGDLLSWVMAHGEEGMAWVTVQTHMNVIAVAVLAEMACVILPENIPMEQESLDKAAAEGMCVLSSPLSGYEICGRMHGAGVPDKG